ncbi:hypothetical protein [Mitsuaria sp. 7]|uniref:hypothetical protein n=1 Tax=Mitsuaria sp. 7 TaxID=1658665 RepID=UPI0018D4B1F5|nr:hypothetical protein [Mitsuaria sp. 7]
MHLIGDPRLTQDARVTELRDLAAQLTECGHGAVVALQHSVARLDPNRQGLRGKCRTIMERTIEQVAAEAVDRRYPKTMRATPGMHRHYVAGLQICLFRELGLPWRQPDDPLAKRTFRPWTVDHCLQQLTVVLTPPALALTLAEDYLARYAGVIRDAGTRVPDTPLTIGEIHEGTLTLLPEFNVTPGPAALVRVDGDTGACVLQNDPILMGLHFLEALSKAEVAHAACHDPVAAWINAGNEPVHCFIAGALAWVIENGTPRPLIAADLPHLARATSAPLSAAARRSISLGSTPADLAAHVLPSLLRDPDTCAWLCDRLDDRLLAPLLMAWQAWQVLTPGQLDWIAQTLAAQGRVDLFMHLPFDWPANARLDVILRALQARPPKLDADGLMRVLTCKVRDHASLLEYLLLEADTARCARLLDELTSRVRRNEIDMDALGTFSDASMERTGIAARLFGPLKTYCALTKLLQHCKLQHFVRQGTSSPRQLAVCLLPAMTGHFPRVIDTGSSSHILAASLAAEVIGKFPWEGKERRGRETLRALLEAPGGCASEALQRLLGQPVDLFIVLLGDTLRAMRRLSFSPEEARTLLRLRTASAPAGITDILAEVARQIDDAADQERLPESLDELLAYTITLGPA